MKKILVCSWLAKNVFFGKPSGGSEKRAYLLFSELPYNKEVSFFIKGTKMDECRLNYQKNNYKLYTTNSWWIIIDFIKNVRKNNIFASFALNRISPVLYFFAKLFNKKTIYFISCDADVGVGLNNFHSYYKWVPKLTFQFTDIFIAQTKSQIKLVKKKYPYKSVYYLPNPVVVKKNITYNNKDYILWVGRHHNTKGLDILEKTIQSLPNIKFKLIGISKDDFNQSIEKYQNVTILGKVDFKNITKYYNNASIVINTSYTEGFPNVFLEAFANKTPIISYCINPDNILNLSKAGISVNSNISQFIFEINKLYYTPKLLEKMGVNGYNYVLVHHNLSHIRQNLINIMDQI